MKRSLLAIVLAAALPAAAQDAYVIGVSAAMTGPAAGIYAPVVDAMKAYLDHVNARGGVYDVFKYRLYSDSLRHNFLFNGRTPYQGAGSAAHRAAFPQLDPNTWNTFDASYKRRDHSAWAAWCFIFPPMLIAVALLQNNPGPRPRRPTMDEDDATAG